MVSYRQQLQTLPKWRATTSLGLTVAALVLIVLLITGVARGAGLTIGFVVIIAASLLIGPRSPLFKDR